MALPESRSSALDEVRGAMMDRWPGARFLAIGQRFQDPGRSLPCVMLERPPHAHAPPVRTVPPPTVGIYARSALIATPGAVCVTECEQDGGAPAELHARLSAAERAPPPAVNAFEVALSANTARGSHC